MAKLVTVIKKKKTYGNKYTTYIQVQVKLGKAG